MIVEVLHPIAGPQDETDLPGDGRRRAHLLFLRQAAFMLSPSQRTAGGHRECTQEDLVRLYQVLALRRPGLALDSIAVRLDAGVDPTRLVRDHLAGVEASAAAPGVLRERLVRLDEKPSADRAPTATALVDALRAGYRP